MCGIAGIILEREAIDDVIHGTAEYDVGALLVKMSAAQQIRGQDSFGLALFNPAEKYKIMIVVNRTITAKLKEELGEFNTSGNASFENLPDTTNQVYDIIEYNINEDERKEFLQKFLAFDGDDIWIISHGTSLTILKDIGLVNQLSERWFDNPSDEVADKYNSNKPWNSRRYATHGLAHVRIATASNVSQRNAHPFCCTNIADVAVVHNGEVTNAARMRNDLILRGYNFCSDNDTETIAAFIGNRLSRKEGITLEDACRELIETASGYYTCLIATPSEIAFIKDIAATRPALYGYHPKDDLLPGFYAIATDISALAAVDATEQIGTVGPGKVKLFPTGIPYTPEKIQVR